MKLGVQAALVDGLLVRGDVEVDDGRIVGVGLASPGRGIAVPGFIDLQVNGFGGVDFLDADADGYRRAGAALLETGVTAYLPTLITTPEQQLVAALARDEIVVSLILDGIHLAPETARTAWNAARGRTALVTDAITGAGVADGSYSLGNLDVHVHEGTVRGPDGVLAGSVLTMIEAVQNLHRLGVPIEDAVSAATATPARLLGELELGRLDVGLPADVVVLNDRVEIERVLVGGEVRVAV